MDSNAVFHHLFNPKGRISRLSYVKTWLATLSIFFAAGFFLALFENHITTWVGVAVAIALAVTAWISIAASIKRLHDMGRSGWWHGVFMLLNACTMAFPIFNLMLNLPYGLWLAVAPTVAPDTLGHARDPSGAIRPQLREVT